MIGSVKFIIIACRVSSQPHWNTVDIHRNSETLVLLWGPAFLLADQFPGIGSFPRDPDSVSYAG